MAQNIVHPPEITHRLEALRDLNLEVATGLNAAIEILREFGANGGNSNTLFMVADSLARIGWLADRAAGIADGSDGRADNLPILGSADAWLLGSLTAETVSKVKSTSFGQDQAPALPGRA